jgi:hypothetical protein
MEGSGAPPSAGLWGLSRDPRYGSAHQLCTAHHLRELAAILDADATQAWADDLSRLLMEIHDTARAVGADAIHPRLRDLYRPGAYDRVIVRPTNGPAHPVTVVRGVVMVSRVVVAAPGRCPSPRCR